MKMKLLFVISQFYKGGAETSLLNLLKFLDNTKYEIDLLIMNQVPVKNAVSLVPQLPKHIHVFDAWSEEQQLSIWQRMKGKVLLTAEERDSGSRAALLFVNRKEYDWAFHIGEWWLPDFVATKVKAKRKAAWIHNDLSHAEYFQADTYFVHDECFDKYIFVSQNSLAASLEKFPFLSPKSSCIYNINDASFIRTCAKEPVEENYFESGLPVLLTCANIRRQKNHMRQLQAMYLLKKRGIEFIWLNIGATTETNRCEEILTAAEELGLKDHFLLAGPRENPYQYMARADAVTVLSDYESWSMVITEAKILRVPVIATKTSGALEQLNDHKTGLLADFSASSIADKIEEYLTSEDAQNTIRENLLDFDNTADILASFNAFVNQAPTEKTAGEKEWLLYVIDDINYMGGAHIATKYQIQELLKQQYNIAVFSGTVPTVKTRNELYNVTFISWQQCAENLLFWRRIFSCFLDPYLSFNQKKYKMRLSWESKVKRNPNVFDEWVKPQLSELFSSYDIVCVMSEGSAFRREVANSSAPRKVQFIHTDYVSWRSMSEWTQKITEDDENIYKKFDKIVLLSENIRNRFTALYPSLREKTAVNKNLMPADDIRRKAVRSAPKGSLVRFITVGRIDYFKGFDRIYNALNNLYEEGYQFHWTIIGNGEYFEELKRQFSQSEFADCIKMEGARSNPFPAVREADVFALLSRYEGLPNTIYEALILGVPVIATNVGGVASQIEVGINGWIVENDESAIYEGIKHVLTHPNEIQTYKENLKTYYYNNEEILNRTEEILFGDE